MVRTSGSAYILNEHLEGRRHHNLDIKSHSISAGQMINHRGNVVGILMLNGAPKLLRNYTEINGRKLIF